MPITGNITVLRMEEVCASRQCRVLYVLPNCQPRNQSCQHFVWLLRSTTTWPPVGLAAITRRTLPQCLPRYLRGQRRGGGLVLMCLNAYPRNIEPLLVQCWSTVYDAGPTLNQQWLNVSCLPGSYWCLLVGDEASGQSISQQADEPMLINCWATGYEAGPPLAHCVLFAGQT